MKYWILILFLLSGTIRLYADDSKQPQAPDSLKQPDTITLRAYSQPSFLDSLRLNPGDSIFVYDGSLFYRARINGVDYFISNKEILSHSDSLFIYQYSRLNSMALSLAKAETISAEKVVRKRCNAITRDGSRCRRLALPNSDKCWQHQK
jgi:hypothetical protein